MRNSKKAEYQVSSRIKDASLNHPLTSARAWLEVADIMSRDVATVFSQESVAVAAKIMTQRHISCVAVANDEGVVGIVSETDFLRKMAGMKKTPDKIKIAEIMSYPVVSVSANISILKASEIELKNHISRFPFF